MRTRPSPDRCLPVAALATAGLALALAASPARLMAQRAADLRSGVHTSYGTAAERIGVDAPMRGAELPAQPARPRRLWPWFTLGGAVVGGATLAALVAASCDAECKSGDGIAFSLLYAVPVGILGGAGVGTLVGLYVDAQRRDARVPADGQPRDGASRP